MNNDIIVRQATPMARRQREREMTSRPAIPWHQHPAWTVYAERHPNVAPKFPPEPYTFSVFSEALGLGEPYAEYDPTRIVVPPAGDDVSPLYGLGVGTYAV